MKKNVERKVPDEKINHGWRLANFCKIQNVTRFASSVFHKI